MDLFLTEKKLGHWLCCDWFLFPGKIISSMVVVILIDNYEKINIIEEDIKKSIKNKSRKTLLKVCLFQIKVSLLTSKFFLIIYLLYFSFYQFFKKKFDEIHNQNLNILLGINYIR